MLSSRVSVQMAALSYLSDKRAFVRHRDAHVANGNCRGVQAVAVVRYEQGCQKNENVF